MYASREERRRVRWKVPWVGRRAAGGLDVFCGVSGYGLLQYQEGASGQDRGQP